MNLNPDSSLLGLACVVYCSPAARSRLGPKEQVNPEKTACTRLRPRLLLLVAAAAPLLPRYISALLLTLVERSLESPLAGVACLTTSIRWLPGCNDPRLHLEV